MATPEGSIKKAINQVLADLHIISAAKAGNFPVDAAGWYYMPVPSGYGVSGIGDYVGHYYGRAFMIEAKRPGKEPTPFQRRQMDAFNCRGERAFKVRNMDDVAQLRTWLLNLLFLP